jgi:hypothetical protein
VTDQVCLAIERKPKWLTEYNAFVAESGKLTVNTSIGYWMRDLTHLQNSGKMGKPKSKLLTSYSILVPYR